LSDRLNQSLKERPMPRGKDKSTGSDPASGRPPPAGPGTRQRIIDAALETLKTEGFAGASARTIARRGGFNQALIFYHFGSLNDLLLAALDETSARRMAQYRAATAEIDGIDDLFRVAADIYREDLDSGHIKVLAEMIAGSSAFPHLGPEIAARIEPWIHFAEERIEAALAPSPLAGLVSPADLALGVVAFYLGIELLSHLDDDRSRAERLFGMGNLAASMLGALAGPSTPEG
jgi:AcrR family transcriptional regulator